MEKQTDLILEKLMLYFGSDFIDRMEKYKFEGTATEKFEFIFNSDDLIQKEFALYLIRQLQGFITHPEDAQKAKEHFQLGLN